MSEGKEGTEGQCRGGWTEFFQLNRTDWFSVAGASEFVRSHKKIHLQSFCYLLARHCSRWC